MRTVTDIHLHSKWSRASSKDFTLSNIAKACEQKGVDFVTTSDALHPAWRKSIDKELEDAGEGTFILKKGANKVHFLLSVEVSCIYKRFDKVRRVHHILLFPSLVALDRFTSVLVKRGCNVKSDGRPILNIDSEELLKLLLDADKKCLLIPAHIWTPWYSVFGSKSGFNSLEECFGEMVEHVYALETGLSSDPQMNWRVSKLDKLFLMSNSDAHSADNIGREANVFDMARPSYKELYRILSTHDTKKFIETIEFFPEAGKYFADGHASCRYSCDFRQTLKMNGYCPVCGKPLTVGVTNRINQLSDRPVVGKCPLDAVPFRSIMPLRDLVACVLGKGKMTQAVTKVVEALQSHGLSELQILLDEPEASLKKITSEEIVAGIIAIREKRMQNRPGYDGVYGMICPQIERPR